MKISLLAIAMAAAVSLSGCNQQAQPETEAPAATETAAATSNGPLGTSSSLTDTAGNTLDMVFDNAKNVVTISFKGQTAELTSERPASGIWYKNAQYELRGKGNDIELKKDGQTVFVHEDSMETVEAKNDKGDVLNMTFNNTAGTVKAYLNGGEQIDLTAEKAASGIWYKNDQYELRGKGEKYELTKDGKTVFAN